MNSAQINKASKASKKTKIAREGVNFEKLYKIEDAINLLKERKFSNFDESVEISINLGVDPKYGDQVVKGVFDVPNGLGKEIRVLAFVAPENEDEAKKAGADVIGSDDVINEILNGRSDFDYAIATPDMMPKVSKVARKLGPKGIMPNPKLGSVTKDFTNAIKKAKSGQIKFTAEKAGIVHAAVGKISFEADKLKENIVGFFTAVNKAKPTGAKGTYFKHAHISSTMGIGLKLDLSSVL